MNFVTMGRRASGKITNPYLMTKDTNPEVLAVCYAKGWCASPDYMTYEEAALVTNSKFGTSFQGNTQITHFEEFEHFTGITTLRAAAFDRTTNLKTIVFPDTLTNISVRCFQLSGITELDTKNAYIMDIYACYACESLQRVILRSTSITNIGNSFFHSCSALQSITIYASTPPSLGNTDVFYNTKGCPIYVPAESVEAYKSAWRGVKSRIQAIPS